MSPRRMLVWLAALGPWWPALLLYWLTHHSMPAIPAISAGFWTPWLEWYWSTNPVVSAAWFALVYAVVLYIGSVITGNCSIFDFNWSMLPASLYVLHFAYHPLVSPDATRRLVVVGVVWLWSVRLTGNWLLKGGLAFEDFRYIKFRRTMTPVGFQLFSLVALFLVQSAMVLAMTLPIYYALKAPGRPFGALDVAAAAVAVFGIAVETVADLQGRRFRAERDKLKRESPDNLSVPLGAPDALGDRPRFPTSGLWRYSRHPNYFGEICVWWGVYLFAVAATGDWINGTLAGPLTIHGLFIGGSVQLTETHELSRKPEYAEYQRTTSRLLPWWPKTG